MFALSCSAVEPVFAQDLPTLSVADATARESNATIDFVVSLSASASGGATVDYATSEGEADTNDFTAASGTLTFAAGTLEQTISVSLVDDSLDELSETFYLTLSDPVGATVDDGVATGTIKDDDPQPKLHFSGYWGITLAEGAEVDLPVILTAPSGRTVTVDYATVPWPPATAEAGSDYIDVSGTLTFDPGETEKTIPIIIIDDQVYEEGERFLLRFSSLEGATFALPPWTVDGDWISTADFHLRDDEQVPGVTIANAGDLESAGELAFPVTLSGPIQAPVSMTYSTADGTAVAGEDYTAAEDLELSFGSGETSKTVRIAITDDSLAEAATKTFFVNLSQTYGPLVVSVGDLQATGTIQDDDGAVGLFVSDALAHEDDGTLSFAVTLGGQSNRSVTVNYATEDGTAIAGQDYTETSGTLSFAPGETRKAIAVPVLDDDSYEVSETFSVSLSGAVGATLDDGIATGTILDDDERSFLTVHGSEGPENGRLDFVVTLSPPVDTTVSVNYTTDEGFRHFDPPAFRLADAGSDFENSSGTLTFAPGETSKTIGVQVIEDVVDEPVEAVVITLFDPVNAQFEKRKGSATCPWSGCTPAACCDCGTILDDDLIGLSIGDAAGLEDASHLAFKVELAARTYEPVSVSYATSDATAVAGEDYQAASGSLTFEVGEVRQTIRVTPLDDGREEPTETFVVTLSSPDGATLSDAEGEGTIVDDDAPSTSIALTAVPSRVSEGAGPTEVTVTATLNANERDDATTVTVTVTGSGEADAVDFAPITDFEITIAAGATSGSGTFTLEPEDDAVDEVDEALTLTGVADLPVKGTTATLTDNDEPSSNIALTAQPPRVSEGDDPTAVEVTATLNASARTEATAVTVEVAGSGKADAVDFEDVSSFTITIAAGDRSGKGTFTLTPMDDEVDEADETLSVTGTSVLPVTGTQVELADDDATPTPSSIALTAEPTRVSEGDGAMPVEVTATLDAGTRTEATTVTVTVSGSGDADAVDFEDVPDFTITIAAGDTSGTGSFTLTPEDDNVDESHETLTVGGNSVLPVTEDTVTLVDDDLPSAGIALSAAPGRIPEDGGATPVQVTATLDASARTVATTVNVSVSGSGQPDAVDYTSTSMSFDIMIAAGATTGTGTITVTPENDEVDERDEVLDITGTSDLSVTPTSVTLADDDQTSTEILLSAVPSTVSEGAGETSVEVTATLDAGARTVSTTVTVEVTDTGDPDAVDFTAPQHFVIPIAAGATSGRGTFILVPEDDNLEESSETLTLDGTADLSVRSASVTLTDNDVASDRITLSASPARVSEDDGAVPVRVTASLNGAGRRAATTVTVSVSGSGNPEAVDFQPVQDFEITIAANAASGEGMFTLVPEDDGTAEADETLTVSGASVLPVTSTTVTLADRDDPSTRILLSAVPGRVSEGGGATPVTVTATLDRARRQQATSVTVSVTGSGDPDAVDFAPIPDFEIVIPANAAEGSATFTVVPEDDLIAEAAEVLTVSGVADLPVRQATMELLDDDEMRVSRVLSIADAETEESAGEVSFAVTLDGSSAVEATVDYSTADPTGSVDAVATAGIDYESVSGTLTFAPGEVSKTIAVRVFDDTVDERDETFALVLSDLQGATLGRGSALGTIRDDDEPPALSVADAAGDEDIGELAFAVVLSAPSLTAVTVDYASTDGTAVAGADYGKVEGTLTFARGEVSQTIRVPVIDDALDEADEETFAVALSAPTGATLNAGAATGTIRDDDEPPALSVADAAGDEDVGTLFGGWTRRTTTRTSRYDARSR